MKTKFNITVNIIVVVYILVIFKVYVSPQNDNIDKYNNNNIIDKCMKYIVII